MTLITTSPHPPGRQALALLLLVLLCLAVGWLGSLVTTPAVREWYPTLTLPSWRPPNVAFSIVWTLLYLLMALGAWLVWRVGPTPRGRAALLLFALQLAANLAWSLLFFGLQSPLAGLIDIALLLALIAMMLVAFWRTQRLAALINLPYLAWVGFATLLNAWIYVEN
jgi:tryptophan-rich sensory protein